MSLKGEISVDSLTMQNLSRATMEYLMQKDMGMMRSQAAETAMLALAIAMGITIVIMLLDLFSLVARAVKHRPAKKC